MNIEDVKLFNGILEHKGALTDALTIELVLKAMLEMPVLIGLYNGTYRALQAVIKEECECEILRGSAQQELSKACEAREAALRDFIAVTLARSIALGFQVGAEYGHTAALGQMGGGSLTDPEETLPSVY